MDPNGPLQVGQQVSFGWQLLLTRWPLWHWNMGGNAQSKQMGHSKRVARSLLDAVVPLRVGSLWDVVHSEAPVGNCCILLAHFCGQRVCQGTWPCSHSLSCPTIALKCHYLFLCWHLLGPIGNLVCCCCSCSCLGQQPLPLASTTITKASFVTPGYSSCCHFLDLKPRPQRLPFPGSPAAPPCPHSL